MSISAYSFDPFDPAQDIPLKLNLGVTAGQISSNFTGRKVSDNFITSGLRVIHDGLRSKIFVIALHIPDSNTQKVHHFKINFYKFSRPNKNTQWQSVDFKSIDDPKAIENLHKFITEQSTLVGLPIDQSDIYRVIGVSGSVDIDAIERFLQDALSGGKVVVEESILGILKKERFTSKRIEQNKSDLIEFRKLVTDPATTETIMQNFLAKHIWFFGLDYIQAHQRCKSKFSSGLGSEYDFLLEGFNQVYDIAELKGPNDSLIDLRSSSSRSGSFDPRNDYKYSLSFGRALHQVISYMYEFEESFGHIKEAQPSIRDFMYPKSLIVISKRDLFSDEGKNSSKYLHLLNRQFANVEILTYDDLGDRAENIIKFIEMPKEK